MSTGKPFENESVAIAMLEQWLREADRKIQDAPSTGNDKSDAEALKEAMSEKRFKQEQTTSILTMNRAARDVREITDKVVADAQADIDAYVESLPVQLQQAARHEAQSKMSRNDPAKEDVADTSTELERAWQKVRALIPDSDEKAFLTEFQEVHDLKRTSNGSWSRDYDRDTVEPAAVYVPVAALPEKDGQSR